MKGLLVSVEEYLSTNYEPDCEYTDGILVERNVGKRKHALWQVRLAAFLVTREAQWGIQTFSEWRMRISATRFRIPDLTVMRQPWSQDDVLQTPPLLVVEIWSEGDRQSALQTKIREYLEFGIAYILVIYPDNPPDDPRFVLFTKEEEHELADGVLRILDSPIEVPLLDIHRGISS